MLIYYLQCVSAAVAFKRAFYATKFHFKALHELKYARERITIFSRSLLCGRPTPTYRLTYYLYLLQPIGLLTYSWWSHSRRVKCEITAAK